LGIYLFLVLTIIALAAGVFLAIRINRFVHSEEFAHFLASRAGAELKLEAELQPLRWEGNAALTESLVLIGGEATALDRLEAKILKAQWNWKALLAGIWKIENIEIQHLSASLKPDASEDSQSANSANRRNPASHASSFLADWLPEQFELGRFDVRSADFRFGKIQTTGHVLSVQPVKGGYDIEARGGSLTVPGLHALTVSRCRIRERGGIYHLDESRFFPPGGGSVSASGHTGRDSILNLEWTDIPVGSLPFPELEKILDGISQGHASLDAKGVWRGNISFKEAHLRELPYLKELGALLRKPSNTTPTIQKLSADFEWAAGNLSITNLVLESDGLARLEGTVQITPSSELSGQIQLGLDLNMLKLFPGARETIFSDARNGWYWNSHQARRDRLQTHGGFVTPSRSLPCRCGNHSKRGQSTGIHSCQCHRQGKGFA
jgi:hypothetical protein